MAEQKALEYVFYIAGKPEKVWDGFVTREANAAIYNGAEIQSDWKPGSTIEWSGKGPDGKPMVYVHGAILKCEAPRLLQYTFAMGANKEMSRVTLELAPESEAVRVHVTHDDWSGKDSTYSACADGWPRILSRVKTLIETGKTFKPH